eukprot:scpid102197/ scgid28195/ 
MLRSWHGVELQTPVKPSTTLSHRRRLNICTPVDQSGMTFGLVLVWQRRTWATAMSPQYCAMPGCLLASIQTNWFKLKSAQRSESKNKVSSILAKPYFQCTIFASETSHTCPGPADFICIGNV